MTTAPSLTIEIVVQDENWPSVITDEPLCNGVATATAKFVCLERPERAIVAFGSDASVRELNERYRGQNKPTNVLSFPAAEVVGLEDGGPAFLGDIILARETVEQEARDQSISLPDHATHLVVHGMLHLLGYDHEDPTAAEEMEALEIDILGALDIANPYTEELIDAG